ncbi:MAG: hypothetical protein WAT39_05335, partial [Planctomycetota bacterium]
PGGGRAPSTGQRGMPPVDDFTTWDYWWEFNKDPFLRLKDAVHQGGPQTGSDDHWLGPTRRTETRDTLRPSREEILDDVLPALKKAIDATDQRDIASSCMVAMAKVGENHPDFDLIDVFRPRLKKHDQEIRETAALALGIAALGDAGSVALLAGLALDNAEGRAASGGAVDDRTRSFATYGLGLTAHRTTNLELKRRAFEVMRTLLADDRAASRNLKVAAISAMSLLDIAIDTPAGNALLDEVLAALDAYYQKDLGVGEQLMQAHCPTAIAKLIGRNHERSGRYRDRFAADLQDQGPVRRSNLCIAQSCALALGGLVRPFDHADEKVCPDGRHSRVLLDTWRTHKDVQTRCFALISLGRIGGEHNFSALVDAFDGARKDHEKPWCALALGLWSFLAQQGPLGEDTERRLALAASTLTDALKASRTPALTGALAIALGLAKVTTAADEMRARMLASVAREDVAGNLCIGLALMNDGESKEAIRGVVKQAARRTDLLRQAAVALGKLGDKRVADDLLALLDDGERNLAKLGAVASALGFIGDRRTIAPLQKLLFDDRLGDLSRAFAAVALGGVADKEPLPWNSKLGVHVNYRATVETLTNQQTGILDIL